MQIWRLILKIPEVSRTVGFRVALGDIGHAVLTTIFSWLSRNFLKRRRSVSSMLISILECSLREGIGLDPRERRRSYQGSSYMHRLAKSVHSSPWTASPEIQHYHRHVGTNKSYYPSAVDTGTLKRTGQQSYVCGEEVVMNLVHWLVSCPGVSVERVSLFGTHIGRLEWL